MSLTLKKIKAYSRVGLVAAVALVIGLVIFYNRNHEVTFWFFRTYQDVNVLWLLVCTAAGTVVSYWVFLTVFSLWKDLRELGQESAWRAREQRQRKIADELAEQERRIDEKRSEIIRKES